MMTRMISERGQTIKMTRAITRRVMAMPTVLEKNTLEDGKYNDCNNGDSDNPDVGSDGDDNGTAIARGRYIINCFLGLQNVM